MEIDGTVPRPLTTHTRDRIAAIVSTNCSGWHCPGGPGRFTKRLIGGAVTIHIQCTGCGRSLSGSLRRADIASWQDLPEWDASIGEGYDQARMESARDYVAELDAARERAAEEAARRRIEYRRWLLTSTEWQTLRDRVFRRAMGQCEACLANRAQDVHHVTYRLGKLPPAWELRAVCRPCHDRLHDWIGGEE